MANRPTYKDIHGLLGSIETDIDWLTKTVVDLQRDLKEHCRNHRQLWFWIVPTVLVVIQFLWTLFDGR